MKSRAILCLALTAVGSSSFGVNLVINGDFELSVPTNGSGNGWTAFQNDGAGGWRSTGGLGGGCFILNDNGSTSTNPSIQQVISGLVVGQQYIVSGQFAQGNISAPGNLDFGVEIDGHLWEFEVPGGPTLWNQFSETFTAASDTVTLLLTAERHGDSDARIDNISLEAVPEPASLAALGLGVVALLRRRRK